MKITFIEPGYNFGGFNVGWINQLPMLGPLYLGTILKEHGHEVEIYKEDLKKPKKLDCDILALYALTSTSPRAYYLAKKFKEENKGRIIMGGVHASMLPNEAIKHVDNVVIGEAEGVILDLVNGKINKKIINGNKCANLNELPFPDISLVKGLNKLNYLPMSTSRGCPYNCRFCSVTKMFGHKYRFRNADNVVNEIMNTKSKRIFFYDDNLCAVKSRTKELLRKMRDNKINREWLSQTRVDIGEDDELLRLMSDTNCERLFIGLESVNDESLRFFNKHQKFEDVKKNIKKIRDHGIKIIGSFVVGADTDDKNIVQRTIDFCDDVELEYPLFNVLTPLPGSDTYNELDREKRIFTKDWSLYDFTHVVFKPKKMSAYELQYEFSNATRQLYFNFRKSFKKWHLFKEFLNPLNPVQTIKTIKWMKNKGEEKNNYLDKLKKMENG